MTESKTGDKRSQEEAVPLHLEPLTLKQANDLITRWHRHHKKATGHRFSIGVFDDHLVCHGAVITGRPVARNTDQDHVAEVTRLVTDGTFNACSMLYAAAARAAKAMGFWWIQTFILEAEPGTTLKAAGWYLDGLSAGGRWGRPSRDRASYEVTIPPKQRWRLDLNPIHQMEADG